MYSIVQIEKYKNRKKSPYNIEKDNIQCQQQGLLTDDDCRKFLTAMAGYLALKILNKI